MNKILSLALLLATSGGFAVLAQVNPIAPAVAQSEIGVHSDHFVYAGNAHQLVYSDNVRATNSQGSLACERLTINLPSEGSTDSHPTNAMAETNVVVFFINKGDTNQLTCDKAIYDYSVVQGVTNETFTFTGHATNSSEKFWITGEPLIWDNVRNSFSGVNFETHFKSPARSDKDTNNSPLEILK